MFDVRIPDDIYQQAARAAQARDVSLEVFVAEAVKLHLQEESEDFDHLFTPEVIAELDGIVAELDAGGKSYSAAEVDAHFIAKRKEWLAKYAG